MKKNRIISKNKEKNLSLNALVIDQKNFLSKKHDLLMSLIFIFSFVMMYIGFEILYFMPELYQGFIMKINQVFAFGGAKVLNLLGYQVRNTGDVIFSPDFSISIKRGCDSLEALAIFICGVIAFPAIIRVKFFGLLIGASIILSMNLVRVVNLFWIGTHFPDYFELFHLEFWQFFFIAQSIILWLLWMKKAIHS